MSYNTEIFFVAPVQNHVPTFWKLAKPYLIRQDKGTQDVFIRHE